jgi:hypothetical protein
LDPDGCFAHRDVAVPPRLADAAVPLELPMSGIGTTLGNSSILSEFSLIFCMMLFNRQT